MRKGDIFGGICLGAAAGLMLYLLNLPKPRVWEVPAARPATMDCSSDPCMKVDLRYRPTRPLFVVPR